MPSYELVSVLTFVVVPGLLAVVVWALYCNHRTLADRLHMINQLVPGDTTFTDGLDRIRGVSYDQHLRARLLLRDPQKLYRSHKTHAKNN